MMAKSSIHLVRLRQYKHYLDKRGVRPCTMGGCHPGWKRDAIDDRFPIAIDLEVLLHPFWELHCLGGENHPLRIASPAAPIAPSVSITLPRSPNFSRSLLECIG